MTTIGAEGGIRDLPEHAQTDLGTDQPPLFAQNPHHEPPASIDRLLE